MPELEVGRHLYRFPGGLRLRHNKRIACREPLARIDLPERLYLPLIQHQGPAGQVLVEVGDKVLKGQPLTGAHNDREVPIHAPCSGRIVERRDWPVSWPPDNNAQCLVLEPDGREEWAERKPLADWQQREPDEIIEHLHAGGLAGLGGAMFPTAAKLRARETITSGSHIPLARRLRPLLGLEILNVDPATPAVSLGRRNHIQRTTGRENSEVIDSRALRGDWNEPEPRVHTLILNGSECEPYISCDEMLMRERPQAVIEGGLMLARALGAEEVVIGIEDQMGAVRQALEDAAREIDPEGRCRVVQVTTIYPEGGEKQLIQVLTGAEVPHDGLPQDLGLVCINVATAAAARDRIVEGTPVIERIVTVSGPAIADPCNLIVPLGTPVSWLIKAAGGTQDEIDRLVLGGPMSGLPLATDRIPIVKGSNCILALRPEDTRRTQPVMPCINCGECVRVCPASLLPQQLYRFIQAGRLDQAEELNLFDCIECGCCAHVCPSHIPLVDWYRHGKGQLRQRGIEEARAQRARARHEARERRLSAREAERRGKREQREQRLSDQQQAKSEVQAAIERARERARSKAGDQGGKKS